jgi:hypothetical protein
MFSAFQETDIQIAITFLQNRLRIIADRFAAGEYKEPEALEKVTAQIGIITTQLTVLYSLPDLETMITEVANQLTPIRN